MKKQNITRRELLKVLAAAGSGLTAAAFLPARWVKPVLESGVLPVHAQNSQPSPFGSISGTILSGSTGISTSVYLYAGGTAGVTMQSGLKVAKPIPQIHFGVGWVNTTTSNSNGLYSFPNLTPGLYDVHCPAAFETKNNQAVTAGNNTVVNFQALS